MKRDIFFSIIIFNLCVCPCISQYLPINPDDIIGKWKLVKTEIGNTRYGKEIKIYSTVDVVLEFMQCDNVTIHCLREDKNCKWRVGNFFYCLYVNEYNRIELEIIGYNTWWIILSGKEFILDKSYCDGHKYYFEKF